MHVERRNTARRPFFATAEIMEPRTRYSVTARTNELSRSGCYMDMLNPLLAGAELKVRIVHGGEAMDVPARVVHSEPNVGMGISFAPTESSQIHMLDQWLAALDPGSEP